MVAPPLSRCQPFWYAAQFTTITSCFAKVYAKAPERLTLLPQFDCSKFCFLPDGLHLTAGEGERYLPWWILTLLISYHSSLVYHSIVNK